MPRQESRRGGNLPAGDCSPDSRNRFQELISVFLMIASAARPKLLVPRACERGHFGDQDQA